MAFFIEAQQKLKDAEAILEGTEFEEDRSLDVVRAGLSAKLARCLRGLRSYGAAEDSYRKAISKYSLATENGWIDIENERSSIHMNYGNFLQDLGRYEEALRCYQNAASTHMLEGIQGLTEVGRIALNKAICLTFLDRLAEANSQFENARTFYWSDNLKGNAILDQERVA